MADHPFDKFKKGFGSAINKAGETAKEITKGENEFLNELQEKTSETVKNTNKKLKDFSQQTNEKIQEKQALKRQAESEKAGTKWKAEKAIQQTNIEIENLGAHTEDLYEELNKLQIIFDMIRNVPSEQKLELEKLEKIRLDWKNQAKKIEDDYEVAVSKSAGVGALGTGAGVAVAALGPSMAMGIATTFGTASTGAAISTLSGAAATNAALASIGGGALATGGGGMAAGKLFLGLMGPVGWTLAGAAILGGSGMFLKARNEKERMENILNLISIRDTKSYELAVVELKERVIRMEEETGIIQRAIQQIRDFGLDYEKMSENQQYELGTFVNFMNSSTQLLVNPILGLQPKYSEEDYLEFLSDNENDLSKEEAVKYEEIIVFLANFLYKIDFDDNDKKLILKMIRSNEELLEAMNLSKEDLDEDVGDSVEKALEYKYQLSLN